MEVVMAETVCDHVVAILAGSTLSSACPATVSAHSGECDRPFQPKVITDSGDRDHAVTRPTGSA
jgi:hypothetical protein